MFPFNRKVYYNNMPTSHKRKLFQLIPAVDPFVTLAFLVKKKKKEKEDWQGDDMSM